MKLSEMKARMASVAEKYVGTTADYSIYNGCIEDSIGLNTLPNRDEYYVDQFTILVYSGAVTVKEGYSLFSSNLKHSPIFYVKHTHPLTKKKDRYGYIPSKKIGGYNIIDGDITKIAKEKFGATDDWEVEDIILAAIKHDIYLQISEAQDEVNKAMNKLNKFWNMYESINLN